MTAVRLCALYLSFTCEEIKWGVDQDADLMEGFSQVEQPPLFPQPPTALKLTWMCTLARFTCRADGYLNAKRWRNGTRCFMRTVGEGPLLLTLTGDLTARH